MYLIYLRFWKELNSDYTALRDKEVSFYAQYFMVITWKYSNCKNR